MQRYALVSTEKGKEFVDPFVNSPDYNYNPLVEIIVFIDEETVDFEEREDTNWEDIYDVWLGRYKEQLQGAIIDEGIPHFDIFRQALKYGYIRKEPVTG